MKKTNINQDMAGAATGSHTISIIGSGNVATHMALALLSAGHSVRQVLSRSFEHATTLARRVGAEPLDDWHRLDDRSEVYLLAVNDDSLYDLALDLRLHGSVVLHTSGSTPLSVLKPVSMRCGVVWSPQTFVRDIAMDYRHLPLCIEGSTPEVEDMVEELFATVSDNIYRLGCEQRCKAHAAAVMVSNFVNAVNASAQRYMEAEGLDFAMLKPLAEQTLRKWDYGDLWQQQTGPAARHDDRTIKAHRRLLEQHPDLLRLYDMMTEIIQNNVR